MIKSYKNLSGSFEFAFCGFLRPKYGMYLVFDMENSNRQIPKLFFFSLVGLSTIYLIRMFNAIQCSTFWSCFFNILPFPCIFFPPVCVFFFTVFNFVRLFRFSSFIGRIEFFGVLAYFNGKKNLQHFFRQANILALSDFAKIIELT